MKANEQIVKDIDGNEYHTIQIGSQVWMTENLQTTRYNDGTEIPLITDQLAFYEIKAPCMCWYNNDESANKNGFGALYNWYAVDTKKICPSGWHVPSNEEWATMIEFLGGANIAGGKLKSFGIPNWTSRDAGAQESSGFNVLPAGFRGKGAFYPATKSAAIFWTSSVFDDDDAWTRYFQPDTITAGQGHGGKYHGFAIRCLKDQQLSSII
jgi:uncharacterized protein (TIGR02145 family)